MLAVAAISLNLVIQCFQSMEDMTDEKDDEDDASDDDEEEEEEEGDAREIDKLGSGDEDDDESVCDERCIKLVVRLIARSRRKFFTRSKDGTKEGIMLVSGLVILLLERDDEECNKFVTLTEEEEEEDADDGLNDERNTLGNEFTRKLLLRLMTLVLWLLLLRLGEMKEDCTKRRGDRGGSDGGGGVKNEIVTMTSI